MKIFNWVHRKFHHKDGFNRDEKKAVYATNEANTTHALLQQLAMADVLDGWREGILAIGTFGFDPLKDINQEKEFLIMADKDDDDDDYYYEEEPEYSIESESDNDNDIIIDEEDEGEMNPLVLTAFRHGFDEKQVVGSANNPDLAVIIDSIPFCSRPLLLDDNDDDDQNSDKRKKKKKGERITLADLFSADSHDLPAKKAHGKLQPDSIGKKQDPNAKNNNGLSFAKKLFPRVKDDSRPIQKLHRMMTRMLKRKIHPDLEGKIIQKKDQQGEIKARVSGLISENYETYESASLLATQDANP